MKKIFNKYLKNKKGLSSIETGICSLIIILCICGFLDLTTSMYKFSTLSSTATYVTRIVERQGGITTSPPSSYRGEFISSGELYNDVKKIMNNAGIEDTNWTVNVNGTTLNGGSNSTIKYYGERITCTVTIKYKWSMVKNFIGLQNEYEKSVTRNSKSNLIKRLNNSSSNFN